MDNKKKELKDTNKNVYDDGNIPDIDKPQDSKQSVEPLPETFRPRKDGPGGD